MDQLGVPPIFLTKTLHLRRTNLGFPHDSEPKAQWLTLQLLRILHLALHLALENRFLAPDTTAPVVEVLTYVS